MTSTTTSGILLTSTVTGVSSRTKLPTNLHGFAVLHKGRATDRCREQQLSLSRSSSPNRSSTFLNLVCRSEVRHLLAIQRSARGTQGRQNRITEILIWGRRVSLWRSCELEVDVQTKVVNAAISEDMIEEARGRVDWILKSNVVGECKLRSSICFLQHIPSSVLSSLPSGQHIAEDCASKAVLRLRGSGWLAAFRKNASAVSVVPCRMVRGTALMCLLKMLGRL